MTFTHVKRLFCPISDKQAFSWRLFWWWSFDIVLTGYFQIKTPNSSNTKGPVPGCNPSTRILILLLSFYVNSNIWDEQLCGIRTVKYLNQTLLFPNIPPLVEGQMSHTCSFVEAEWQSEVGGAAVVRLSLTEVDADSQRRRTKRHNLVGKCADMLWACTSGALFYVFFFCVREPQIVVICLKASTLSMWSPSCKPVKVFVNKCI